MSDTRNVTPTSFGFPVERMLMTYRACLEGGGGVPGLLQLDYLLPDGQIAPDVDEQEWHLHFLQLASRFTWIAPLTPPIADGPRLIGCAVQCSAFGLTDVCNPILFGGGRGRTWRDAFEGCVAEAVERLCLEGSSSSSENGLIAVNDMVTGEACNPVYESLVRRVGSVGDSTPNSNGCGVGRTRDDAIVSGLFEAIERDAISIWWHGGRPAIEVSREEDLLGRVFGRPNNSVRQRWLLDLSTSDLRVPVVAAVSASPNGKGVVVGASASLSITEAAERAALELFQMEHAAGISIHRKKCGEPLSEADRLWIDRLDTHDADCPAYIAAKEESPAVSVPIDAVIENLGARIAALGERVNVVDLSKDFSRLKCFRVLAPALQSTQSIALTPRLNALIEKHQERTALWRDLHAPI